MKNKVKRNEIIIVICFIAFIIGLGFVSYNYIIAKTNYAFESINLEINGNKEPEYIAKEEKEEESSNEPVDEGMGQNEVVEEQPKKEVYKDTYIGTLEIPKIGLTKGFVDMNSNRNNVDYNMQIIKPSDYPNVDKGNFIIASHSGTSNISYFKNLYKLTVSDEVTIYYNNVKYVYKIVKIYNHPKNGTVAIYRDENKTTITLITCTKNDENNQTVYIGELVSKNNY